MNTEQLVAIAKGWNYRHKEVSQYLRDNQRPIYPYYNSENQDKNIKRI